MPENQGEENETTPPGTSPTLPASQEPAIGSRELAKGSASKRRRIVTWAWISLGAVAGSWLLAAYLILPAIWRHYEHQPALETAPKTTLTLRAFPETPSTSA